MTPDAIPVVDVWLIVLATACLMFSAGVVCAAAYLTRR